jgi:DNA-binding ferritin-like protein (Dps family)
MSNTVKNWDGTEYTLEEIREIVECALDSEQSVDEVMGGDLANSEFVIRGLLDIIENVRSVKNVILMGRDNPEGWKLEDILLKIASELEAKNEYLHQTGRTDLTEIITNNSTIIDLLRRCASIQLDSMKFMEKFGPNKGPLQPRV